MASSTVLLSGTGDNSSDSLPVTKSRHRSPRTSSFTSSSTSSSSSSSSRNSSFGSLSFSSYPENSPLHSFFTLQNSGIPFSWEQHPGIPKKLSNNLSRSIKKGDHSSIILLPLPPASGSNLSKRFSFDALFAIRKKTNTDQIIKRDPFVAALMKCSKDVVHDHDHDQEISTEYWKDDEEIIKTVSNSSFSTHRRFGFNVIDCKNSCSVEESKVLVPKSSRSTTSGTYYDRLNR